MEVLTTKGLRDVSSMEIDGKVTFDLSILANGVCSEVRAEIVRVARLPAREFNDLGDERAAAAEDSAISYILLLERWIEDFVRPVAAIAGAVEATTPFPTVREYAAAVHREGTRLSEASIPMVEAVKTDAKLSKNAYEAIVLDWTLSADEFFSAGDRQLLCS